jgi:phosphoribosylformylglycinamidine synthase I
MTPRVAVLVFPGTNSEHETAQALEAAGLSAHLVRWSEGAPALRGFDGYVLPGGFAYEDRVRAGAIAAHEPMLEAVIEAAQRGRFVVGLCNGAQILLETGLVPGDGPLRRPSAAFAPNLPGGRYRCVLSYIKLNVAPNRSPLTSALPPSAVIPAWVSHGEGRLAASGAELERLVAGEHVAFVYSDAAGVVSEAAVPNGSALSCAGLVNRAGNVLALMPHPERIARRFQLHHGVRGADALAPGGGSVFFDAIARALAEGIRA